MDIEQLYTGKIDFFPHLHYVTVKFWFYNIIKDTRRSQVSVQTAI